MTLRKLKVEIREGGVWFDETPNYSKYVKDSAIADYGGIDALKLWISRGTSRALDRGDEIKVSIGDTIDFAGYIINKKTTNYHQLFCRDYGDILLRTVTADLWDDTAISSIVSQLVAKNTDLDISGIVTTTIKLSQFKANYETLYELITKLAIVLNWQFYVDYNRVFHFEPKGSTSSGISLNVSTNVGAVPTINRTGDRQVDKFIVRGANRLFSLQETFSGDGSETKFTLTHKPAGFVRITVGGTEQVGGIDDVSTNVDYTVDVENKLITFKVGSTPPAAANNIVVLYGREVPIIISSGGADTGYIREKFMLEPKLNSVTDTIQYTQKYREEFGSGEFGETLLTSEIGLMAGKTITVTDEINDISGTYVIKAVQVVTPPLISKLTLGKPEDSILDIEVDLQRRIDNLEKQILGDTDLVTLFWNPQDQYCLAGSLTRYERLINTSFVLGHTTRGKLGSGLTPQPVLGDQTGAWVEL